MIYWGTMFQIVAWGLLMALLIVSPQSNWWVAIIAGAFMAASVFVIGRAFRKDEKAFLLKYEDLVREERMQRDYLEIIKRMLWKIGQHEGSRITEEEFKDIDLLKKKYNVK